MQNMEQKLSHLECIKSNIRKLIKTAQKKTDKNSACYSDEWRKFGKNNYTNERKVPLAILTTLKNVCCGYAVVPLTSSWTLTVFSTCRSPVPSDCSTAWKHFQYECFSITQVKHDWWLLCTAKREEKTRAAPSWYNNQTLPWVKAFILQHRIPSGHRVSLRFF